jgi:hypothetical protein
MKILFQLAILVLFLVSCNKTDDNNPAGNWSNSVFIVNEGPFQNGTGTIMAYDRTSGQVSADLFEAVNGRPLGNIVQSMAVYRDKAWIVVNNSSKICVVDLETFHLIYIIEDAQFPRYVVFKGDTAFISSWDSGIVMIDAEHFYNLGEFAVGHGPDEMVIAGDFIFTVCTGGWEVWNKVTFANINDQNQIWDITVADRPCSILKDKYNKLWVLCSGKGYNGFPDPDTDTPGALFCIDPVTKQIISQLQFPTSDFHPDQLIINENGTDLYYALPDGVYTLSVDNPELASTPFIPSSKMFYGLGFDPVSDMVYASDPLDYTQNGYVYRFNSSHGSPVDTIMAGVAPNGFWFND